MNIGNLKISTRLRLGFATVLLLRVFISGTGVLHLQSVGAGLDEMVRNALVKERLANEWAQLPVPNVVRTFAINKPTVKQNAALVEEAAASAPLLPEPGAARP